MFRIGVVYLFDVSNMAVVVVSPCPKNDLEGGDDDGFNAIMSQVYCKAGRDVDSPLFKILMDLHFWQHRVRAEWICAFPSDIVDTVGDEIFVLNFYDEATLMPNYFSFHRTWNIAGHHNPFEVKWLDFNILDVGCVRYLHLVIETLDEQSLWWGSWAPTHSCLAYGGFMTFLERLKGLSGYVMFEETKRGLFT